MPWAPLAAAGIGGVTSIIGGILGGRKKTTTSTTTPTWSPEMQRLQSQLADYSSNLMRDPSAGLQPTLINNQDRINREYMQMPGQVSRMMAARGYGSSGSMGNTMYKLAMGRSGDMSDLQSRIAQMILSQKNQGASLSEQLLQLTRGSTSTGNTPSTALSDGFMSAGNGLNNIATMLTLSKLLKPGGTPSYTNQQPAGTGWDGTWKPGGTYGPEDYTAGGDWTQQGG